MVRHDLYITVPPFFKCPISLDIMKSPVSLSTGVTYDRSSIQKWLDEGHNTCPATMQVLESKEIIPNYTLRRLIQVWSVSNQISTASSSDSAATASSRNLNPIEPQIGPRQAQNILQDIKNGAMDSEMLSVLLRYAVESEKNRESLVKAGAVPILGEILSLNDKESGQFSKKRTEIRSQVIKILCLIPHSTATARILVSPQPLNSIVEVFHNGTLDARIESAKLIESLAIDGEMKTLIASHDGMLAALLKLSEADARATEPALRCLLSLCMPKRNRFKVVRLGAVGHMSKLLRGTDAGNAERILALLELISACADGRTSIAEHPQCIEIIVHKMLKLSDSATEHCVIILWAVCCLSSDQRAHNAVVQSGGLPKILLLMQSNCSPAVRQMAGDLLKMFREMSKEYPNYSYDSKMTHIMPF